MLTSNKTTKTTTGKKITRSIALESSIGVAVTLALAALFGVPFLGLAVLDPHPVWLVVVVIAARYGTRGLAISMLIAWGALAAANGVDGPARVLDTLAMPIELGALAGTVLVSWITSSNERRERALADRVADLEKRVATDVSTIRDLRHAALALRARNDRLDLSLTFLRNIARRLHGSDAEAAAQAALELIGARIGARAASIEMLDTGRLHPLAVTGIWNREGADRTALAVIETGQPVRAVELAEGGADDSDIAAPITDATGEVRGVVAARGVPGGGSSMAALRDLAVIADWASHALCTTHEQAHPDRLDDEPAAGDESESSDREEERESTPLTMSRANV
jgi:polysaccharide biosynthesis protein PelD